MDPAPELKRSLFGYRKEDVESILEARERMFERVTEEAAQRQIEVDQLRADLDRAREETSAARDDAERVRTELNAQLTDVRQELERVRSDLARIDDERREAETRATGLEAELRESRREATAAGERLGTADATEADLRHRLDASEAARSELRARLDDAVAAAPDTRELGEVIEATRQAIARVMAGAKRDAEEDLARVQRTRDELQGEVERVRSWRGRIEPVTLDVVADIAVAQAEMSQTANRVGEALRPMSDALKSLSNRLQQLARAIDPAAIGERPDRVDLVSPERERATSEAGGSEEEAPQEASTGASAISEPWPDPWR